MKIVFPVRVGIYSYFWQRTLPSLAITFFFENIFLARRELRSAGCLPSISRFRDSNPIFLRYTVRYHLNYNDLYQYVYAERVCFIQSREILKTED